MLEEGLYLLLTGNADLNTVAPAENIFLNFVPEGAITCKFGAVSFNLVSSNPDATLDGPSGLNKRRYQFTCFAQTYLQAITIRDALRKVIDGFTGVLTDVDSTRVYDIQRDSEMDMYLDNGAGIHTAIVDYFIYFAQ